MKKGVYGIILAVLTAAVGSGCICIGGCSRGWENDRDRFNRTQVLNASMTGGADVFWGQTENGSITLRGTDTNLCEVTAEITARSFTPEEAEALAKATEVSLVQDGSQMKAQVRRPDLRRGESVSVSFDVTVPHVAAAELHTRNGTISVAGLDAPAAAYTSNGRIKMTAIRGDVTARTRNGNVQLRDITADRIDVETSNGSVHGEGLAGDIKASTSNGNIRLIFVPEASTRNVELWTSNSGIEVKLPRDFSAQVDASASNGKIHTQLPLTINGTISNSVNGTLGDGEGRLILRTSNGSITIKGAD